VLLSHSFPLWAPAEEADQRPSVMQSGKLMIRYDSGRVKCFWQVLTIFR